MPFNNSRDLITGSIHRAEEIVKHGKLKLRRKKLKDEVLKSARENIPNYEREKSCAHARRTADSPVAQVREKISKEIGNSVNAYKKKV